MERKPKWIKAFLDEYNEAVQWYNRARYFMPPNDLKLVELDGYIGGMVAAAKALNYRPKYVEDTLYTAGDHYKKMEDLLPKWQKREPVKALSFFAKNTTTITEVIYYGYFGYTCCRD